MLEIPYSAMKEFILVPQQVFEKLEKVDNREKNGTTTRIDDPESKLPSENIQTKISSDVIANEALPTETLNRLYDRMLKLEQRLSKRNDKKYIVPRVLKLQKPIHMENAKNQVSRGEPAFQNSAAAATQGGGKAFKKSIENTVNNVHDTYGGILPKKIKNISRKKACPSGMVPDMPWTEYR